MPFLFSIGVQGALEEVANMLFPGEKLCAFLDNVYVLCPLGVEPEHIHTMGENAWQPSGINHGVGHSHRV